jgi:hypothetical protein
VVVSSLNDSPPPLLFWLLGSVLIYALATNALWLARFFATRRLTARDCHPERAEGSFSVLVKFFAALPGQAARTGKMARGGWLWEVGRFLFYLGIPYLVLGGWPLQPFQGLLSLQEIGFVGLGSWTVTRWLAAVGTGLGLGSVALVILFFAWHQANDILRLPRDAWWAIIIDAIYMEVHWTFYRASLAVLLGDLYLGVFTGLGLVYAEWAANPFWRRGWAEESQAAGQWLRAALAMVSALIFLLTQNLWICLTAHWLVELVFYSHSRQKAHNPPAVVG